MRNHRWGRFPKRIGWNSTGRGTDGPSHKLNVTTSRYRPTDWQLRRLWRSILLNIAGRPLRRTPIRQPRLDPQDSGFSGSVASAAKANSKSFNAAAALKEG